MEDIKKHENNYSLDIIRIIAALMVITVHIGSRITVSHYTAYGAKGVSLFFILSGYLAMVSYKKLKDSQKGVKEYYKNRLKRLLPEYYFILFVEYFYSIFLYHSQGIPFRNLFEPINGACGFQYLKYFLFLHFFIPSDNYELWNNRFCLWTMSCFFLFYLLVPIIYKIFNSFIKSFIFTSLFLILNIYLIPFINKLFVHFGSFEQSDVLSRNYPIVTIAFFMIGVTIFHASNNDCKYLILLLCTIFRPKTYFFEMVFTVIILIGIQFPINKYINEKSKNIIKYLSNSSFFIYLIHPILIDHIVNLFYKKINGINSWLAFIFVFIILFSLSLVCYEIFLLLKRGIQKIKKGKNLSKIVNKF